MPMMRKAESGRLNSAFRLRMVGPSSRLAVVNFGVGESASEVWRVGFSRARSSKSSRNFYGTKIGRNAIMFEKRTQISFFAPTSKKHARVCNMKNLLRGRSTTSEIGVREEELCSSRVGPRDSFEMKPLLDGTIWAHLARCHGSKWASMASLPAT